MCIHIYIYEQQFHPQTQQKHMHMFTKRSIQKMSIAVLLIAQAGNN